MIGGDKNRLKANEMSNLQDQVVVFASIPVQLVSVHQPYFAVNMLEMVP
jgi:carbonic anhydrase/acetyltransferase-like protein (isoleucine patch superfamily)